MIQTPLSLDMEEDDMPKSRFAIGRAYELHLPYGPKQKCQVYHRGSLLKEVDLSEKAQRQLLVIELIQLGVTQSKLAKALKLSRQTLHNYRSSYNAFGIEGLLHGYKPSESSPLKVLKVMIYDQLII